MTNMEGRIWITSGGHFYVIDYDNMEVTLPKSVIKSFYPDRVKEVIDKKKYLIKYTKD